MNANIEGKYCLANIQVYLHTVPLAINQGGGGGGGGGGMVY